MDLFSPKSFLLLAATVALAGFSFGLSAATVEVRDEVTGPTPEVSAYNFAHFMPGGNAVDWWRYSRVSGARMFLSPSHFQVTGTSRPGESWVTTQDSFVARRTALREDPLDLQFVNWPVVEDRFHVPITGNNRIVPHYAFEQIHRLGGAGMAQLSITNSSFPIAGEEDWHGKWITWRTYYSIVFYLAREFDVQRYTAYNEPNHANSYIAPEPWLMRIRLASDATRCAIADVNRIYGKDLRPMFVAPVTAGAGAGPYADYGQPAVQGMLIDYLGQTSSFNRLLQLYAYQQYNASAAGFASSLNSLRNMVIADLPDGVEPLPFAITEFNVHTGATYDGMSATPDTLEKAVRFAAITSQLTAAGMNELYAFKFGMTAYPATRNYPVQKNGMLYTDNDHSPHNYGTMTRSAEAYRLFNKGFAPGRDRLAFAITGTGASDLDVQISRDPRTGFYSVFSINNTDSAIPFDLDLSALSIPDGNHVIIEDVSQWRRGLLRSMERVQNGLIDPGSQPGQSVWLISIPGLPQRAITEDSNLLEIPVSRDAMVRDGEHASTNFGEEPVAWARNHASNASERAAAFLQFDLPDDWNPEEIQLAVLTVPVAPVNGGSETVHAHLYGIDNHDWEEAAITWNNAPNLRKNAPPGNEIRHGVVDEAGDSAHILAQLTASGSATTTRRVDVTDYLIRQNIKRASFLITQDPRWNVDIHHPIPAAWSDLPRGDNQPDGLRIRTREAESAGEAPATLILIRGPRLAMDFDSWIERAFPKESDPAIIGPQSSPAGNAVPNLLTFALGLDPATPSLENLLLLESSEAGPPRFHYQRNKLAADVVLEVEASHDLVHWSAENLTVAMVAEDEAIARHVATFDTVPALDRLFFRLRASLIR